MAKRGRAGERPERVEDIPGQGERLRQLRNAYDYPTSNGFAASLGITPTIYNGYENGIRLSLPSAIRIVRKIPGMTLDWLYFGKADGLPLDVARRLGLLEAPGKRRT